MKRVLRGIKSVLVKSEPPPANAIKIQKLRYKPAAGSFGILLPDKQIRWENCRDRFQGTSNLDQFRIFLFSHQAHCKENIIEFMRMIEQIIGLPSESCLEINATTETNVLHIKMSDWWQYRVRRSLLTALLRCGQQFDDRTGKGFTKALYSLKYTLDTKYAIERFLAGYTASKLKRREGFGGWQSLFGSKYAADKYLVKLKKREQTTTEISGELS